MGQADTITAAAAGPSAKVQFQWDDPLLLDE